MRCISSLLLLPSLAFAIPSTNHHGRVIFKDVVVVGGGASGTYAAIRLAQENKTVAVIERNDRLGGQVNTYKDPKTGAPFDHGVMVYGNDTISNNFFSYLGVKMARFSGHIKSNAYADFSTGKIISAATAMNMTGNYLTALGSWRAQLDKYLWLSNETGFHLPETIPDELFLPFGEYSAKYNLGGLMALLATTVQNGYLLQTPTFYMMKWLNINQSALKGISQADGNNQAIYDAAQAKLGEDSVFLNSTIQRITRFEDFVEIVFSTPSGEHIVIADQLVMSIPPKLETLDFLDVSKHEHKLFKQFSSKFIYTTVLLNTGLSSEQVIQNFNPQKGTFGIPYSAATAAFSPSQHISSAAFAQYASPYSQTEDEVKANIFADFERVQKAFNLTSPHGTKPILTDFYSHSPYFFTVPEESIRGGFYNKLNSLQGKHRTWWTGAAFESQDSAGLWLFTEKELLPRILKA
ncbi:Hypothetical protein R9X50_00648700 [Acrodontium crateriforme]|uniref:Uncharacterized protein n=1 Tax=Acrodontium crateriforme TaxID=150365 RepID=A0AAQ3M8F0_9PEZI|nr:Hypothetical protein R9X50_00648700 [Acrodontium crateriforme]